MIQPKIRLLAFLVIAPVCALAIANVRPHSVTTTQRRDPVYATMVGQWQGTIEERDECDSTRRTKRVTHVRVSPVPDSDALELQVTTKDGADRVVRDTDRLQFDEGLTVAQWTGMGDTGMQHYDVHVADSLTANSPWRIVMERERGGDDIPATIRETVTVAPGEIRIVQETRTFGGEFEFQRAYVLRRIG